LFDLDPTDVFPPEWNGHFPFSAIFQLLLDRYELPPCAAL